MPKKYLSDILRIRTETIEFRRIRSELMKAAQNRQVQYRAISLAPGTILQLQNEGIKVELINEFGYEKHLLSWQDAAS